MEALLEVKDLTVAYHRKPVLENFNLTVQRGDIYGIIGNNGVGKTTLLKVITGLLRSDRGEVKIRLEGGKKATIGTLIEKPGLFKDMSAYENIKAKALFLGVKYAKKDAVILHPGPVNRGVELTPTLIDGKSSEILEQVTCGVAVRMALLKLLSEYREANL